MKIFKTILSVILISGFIIGLNACSKTREDSNVIRVGTIAGPESELMEVADQVAKRYGIELQIIQFDDYAMPNEALADGSIDANVFQHQPYLDATLKAKGYPLVAIAKTFLYPMAIYSSKIKNLSELAEGASVAIPNDPSNEARALLLLQKAGLIELKSGAGDSATVLDITKNPKKLAIETIDAAQLPRVLPDVDIAAINTNYALMANLSPLENGLFVEDKNSPYANLVVVRAADKDKPIFAKLVMALHSPEVLAKAKTLFKGQAIPAW